MKAFAVYLCGDELPTALFPFYDDRSRLSRRKEAESFRQIRPHWQDKRVEVVDLAELDASAESMSKV